MRISTCDKCKASGVWVNCVHREIQFPGQSAFVAEYCGECFERVLGQGRRRKPTTGHAATRDDLGPWQENAIRELEDCNSSME